VLGLPKGDVKVARGHAATDVAFLFAQRASSELRFIIAAGPEGNICPECGQRLRGKGFGGIDAHWRSRHEDIMPYKEAWPLVRSGIYRSK
jgi:hypothetical protein